MECGSFTEGSGKGKSNERNDILMPKMVAPWPRKTFVVAYPIPLAQPFMTSTFSVRRAIIITKLWQFEKV